MTLRPYIFRPYLKRVVWGGNKIASYKGIRQTMKNIGESWEISCVTGHESICADRGIPNDEDKGLNLRQLVEKYGGRLVGKKVYESVGTDFPLLVKFIDSAQDLSIQVHPNDELARERHGCCGKTEMWYIIEAEEDARICAGLKQNITPDELERLAYAEDSDAHTFAPIIASHDSHKGDCFYLPSGRIHTICRGNLLCEIQQTSDITYRIFDYGRKDADGNARELHIEQARDAIDYRVQPEYRTLYDQSKPSVELVKCPYFTVHREMVSSETNIDYHTDSFVIVVCIEGKVTLNGVTAKQGQVLLVPACDNILNIKGEATLLTAFV